MSNDSAYSAFRRLSLPSDAMSDPITLSRRRFLQAVSLGVAVPVAMGTLFDDVALASVGNDPLQAGEGVLVLIGMYGGNDGMNTVVPYASADYARRRANIALSNTLDLDGRVGLHPALTTVKGLYDAGQVAVVQNVGTPDPDFSHFTAMARWMRGETATISAGTGWIGRWLDRNNDDVFNAVTVGSSLGLHMIGQSARAIAVGYKNSMFGVSNIAGYQRHFNAIRGFAGSGVGGWHDTIADVIGLELDVANKVSSVPTPSPNLPDIVGKMTMAARLINANIGCRVVDVSWGGFDTHAGELAAHGARMTEFDAAVAAFYAAIDPAIADRVVMMTWSEFGRTFSSTASAGTDHGSVNPLFVIGRKVKGGVYGDTPSLVGNYDRPQPTIDFRSVYTSVLDSWMGGGAAAIVGGNYSNLGLISGAPTGTFPVAGPRSITAPAKYVGIVPQRIFDSRNAIGTSRRTRLGPGERVSVAVSGVGAIPATGVVSVAVNITSTGATSDSYVTAWPTGRTQPDTSNLNPRPGRTVPNFAMVAVGADGTISLFNERGSGHLLVDAIGYCTEANGAGFVPLAPARVMDTRSGVGAPSGRVGPRRTIDLALAGVGGVPAQGADVVVLNVTATAPDGESFVTVWPTGAAMPDASTLNMNRGQTVPNLVFARLGDAGRVSLFNSNGSTHLIADVLGYFSSSSTTTFVSVEPTRILDTRRNLGMNGPVTNAPFSVAVPGLPTGTIALMLNVTATAPTTESYATVWASGRPQPGTSNLNYVGGDTVANAVIAEYGSDGRIQFANAFGSVQLIADLVGYFVA